VVSHLGQPVAEPPGGDPHDDAAEPLAAPAASECLPTGRSGVSEAEVLDRHRPHPTRARQLKDAADRSPQVSVPGRLRQPGQRQRDGHRPADRVAVPVDRPAGQVVGVEVHRHHSASDGLLDARNGAGLHLPARGEMPALPGGVQGDVVAHRASGGLGGDLLTPIGEGHRAA